MFVSAVLCVYMPVPVSVALLVDALLGVGLLVHVNYVLCLLIAHMVVVLLVLFVQLSAAHAAVAWLVLVLALLPWSTRVVCAYSQPSALLCSEQLYYDEKTASISSAPDCTEPQPRSMLDGL
jgi:hypothetical protein